jgi:hypothetical protein
VVCLLVRDGSYKLDVAYDGFGNVLDSWNMSTFTNFTWGGGFGHRQTRPAFSSVYVRARHYSYPGVAWTTRDPLWPSEMPGVSTVGCQGAWIIGGCNKKENR